MNRKGITCILLFMLVCITVSTFALKTDNAIIISGKVTEGGTGKKLAGVSIVVKDINLSTTTNTDGDYSINAKMGDVLIFSYEGFEKEEVKITKTKINVHLKANKTNKEDLVTTELVADERIAICPTPSEISPVVCPKPERSVIVLESKDISSKRYDYTENNDEYTSFAENRFISPLTESLSTFSIDVDRASYTNFRRYINQGQKPPKDAIRIEEFINYFNYKYDQPTNNNPVKITTEVGNCPWAEQHRLVRIGIKAKEIAQDELPASNFVFLIDVSGSMYGPTRLDLVKSSLKLLINNLRDKDKVAIVVYAGSAGEVLASTSGSDKQKIREALENLTAGGSTAGGEGIKLAYKIAKQNFVKGGNNRIILCTDGDFNVGVSSNEGLENLIENERKSGVFLSILGYGMGNYKDSKMQILAQKGNGNAAYIDNLQEANRVLVHEFGGTLFTVAKDVKLQVEFNPTKVQSYRLVGYESRMLNKEDFNDDTKDAGEMGAGHSVTALYEIVPVGVKSKYLSPVDDLKYQKINKEVKSRSFTNLPELLTIKLRYKQPDGEKSVKMEIPLVDNGKNNVSSDFKFASAVAMFAQLLKDSDYKGNASYDKIISLARTAMNDDTNGYRHEFARLVETTKNLD